MSCLDYFTDYKGMYVVMMYSEKLTLQDVVMKYPASGCPVKFVKKALERIVKNVHSIHKDGVIHRYINLQAFTMRESSSGSYKVSKL